MRETSGPLRDELELPRHDGQLVLLAVTLTPLRSPEGALEAILIESEDITQHRALETGLRETERRLTEAQSVARIGSWEFALDTGVITWSAETFRLFGFDPSQPPPDYPTHLARHHPEDRPLLVEAVQRAMTEGTSYDLQLRIVLESGEIRWMHCLGHALRNSRGQCIKLAGISQDITDWKHAELEQLRRERALTEVLDVMPHLAILVDTDGFAHYYNGHFYSFTGLSPTTPVFQINWRELIHPDDIPVYEGAVDFLPECTEPYECEIRIRRGDGALRWHLMRVVPIFAGEREVQRFVVTGTDISERRQQAAALLAANSRLEIQASTDALTGIYNRYALDERLEMAWNLAKRTDTPLSLVLLDVDHFKPYNDTYGHVCGDSVLKLLGELLLANARGTDMVARYGGEEFMAVLPQTDAASATRWAERLRCQIESRTWPRRAITASFGVASKEHAQNLTELIACTDRALYRAKERRNCVVTAPTVPFERR